MTVALMADDLAKKLGEVFPGSIIGSDKIVVIVDSESLYKVAEYLKNSDEFEFDYLANLTAVDYMDYFEIIYNLVSLKNNHSLVLKTRCYARENPTVPSVVNLWRTADYQERETFDLFGITFAGHPNLKRLFMWEGFEGHPLRRDYL
jgi:NADH-quinone oxidoreductase subunit C